MKLALEFPASCMDESITPSAMTLPGPDIVLCGGREPGMLRRLLRSRRWRNQRPGWLPSKPA